MSIALRMRVRSRKFASAAQKAVALELADRADDDGRGVWLSKPTIAAATGQSLSTVKRQIAALQEAGVIHSVGKRLTRCGHTIEYRFDLDRLSELETVIGCGDPVHSGPGPQRTRSTVTPDPVHDGPATRSSVDPNPSFQSSMNRPGARPRGFDFREVIEKTMQENASNER